MLIEGLLVIFAYTKNSYVVPTSPVALTQNVTLSDSPSSRVMLYGFDVGDGRVDGQCEGRSRQFQEILVWSIDAEYQKAVA